MTRAEAKKLKVGDYVTSARFAEPYRPCRVTALWRSADSELIRISTGSAKGPWWWTEDLIMAPGPAAQWRYVDGGWERLGTVRRPKSVPPFDPPLPSRQE